MANCDKCGSSQYCDSCDTCPDCQQSVVSNVSSALLSFDFHSSMKNVASALESLQRSPLTEQQKKDVQLALSSSQLLLDRLNATIETTLKNSNSPQTIVASSSNNSDADSLSVQNPNEWGVKNFPQVVKAFIEDTPYNVEKIESAMFDEWNLTVVNREVQTLLGGASHLPAQAFVDACIKLQQALALSNRERIISRWLAVKYELELLQSNLANTIAIKLVSTPVEKKKPLVLIGDDDRSFRLFLRGALECEDYQIIQAVNGEDVIDACLETPPDAILLDINMPLIDGFKVCEKVLALEGQNNPKIIMMSSLGTDDIKRRSIAAGAIKFIEKSINAKVMINHVRSALESQLSNNQNSAY